MSFGSLPCPAHGDGRGGGARGERGGARGGGGGARGERGGARGEGGGARGEGGGAIEVEELELVVEEEV